jgi:integrase/recombinase XerD
MSNELVKASTMSVPATGDAMSLPELVERAGGAARFAWEEFFHAEHHNRHTQRAYLRAVKAFLGWAEGQGVELAAITPGMVGQYLVGLGGSPAKRNQHLAALLGFFDRLVNRHVCILNPAASVKGVKDRVIEGKTPEITIEQARTLIRSVDTGHVVGLRDRAILATLAYTACRAGAVAKLRLGDFQHDGTQYVLRFQEKAARAGKSLCGTTWRALYWLMSMRLASPVRPRIRRCSGRVMAGAGSWGRSRWAPSGYASWSSGG